MVRFNVTEAIVALVGNLLLGVLGLAVGAVVLYFAFWALVIFFVVAAAGAAFWWCLEDL
jgi:hypothetical protein